MLSTASGLKGLKIIHSAMLGGQLLFAGIIFYLVNTNSIATSLNKDTEKILQAIAIVFAAGGFFAGTALFKKKLLEARNIPVTEEKFSAYRSAVITQWAMLEGPSLLCVVCFFVTGNYAFFILALVLIIIFYLAAPKRTKIAYQLALTEEEASDL